MERVYLYRDFTLTLKLQNDFHLRKIMLSVWWVVKWIIHWGILPADCSITADLYCQQLDRVAAKLQGKQDWVYLLHDNARAYIGKSTREKIIEAWMGCGFTSTLFSWLGPKIITICFVLFLIIWGRKSSTTRRISKRIWLTSSTKSLKASTKAGSFL